MESFPERLRSLTHNKYFAIIAVIFFAFLTALLFALFAVQDTFPTASGRIRSQVQKGGSADQIGSQDSENGSASTQTGQQKSTSPLDAIIAVITGNKATSTEQKNQNNTNQKGSTANQGSNNTGGSGGTVSKIDSQTPLTKKLNTSAGSTTPKIVIGKHILVTELPPKPSSLTIHQLKNNYTIDDIKAFAGTLGFSSIDGVEQGSTLTRVYNIDSESYLSFNPRSGRFTYLSSTGFRPKLPSSSALQLGKNILTQLGIDNPAIKPYATYERSDDNADYVYIELHNNWEAFGGPIMNPIGMLNLQEDTDISSIKLGALQKAALENINIVNTTDNTDGFARRGDFNTITIKYLPSDGKVYGVSSNLPAIIQTESVPTDSIKTPIQAFNDYTTGKTTFSTTGPSGVGSASLGDIYSSNQAHATSVDVTDAEIIYAATPKSIPQWWCPVYVFRSFGKVQTGFEVQFVHTVPATTDPRCQTAILGTSTTRSLAQNSPIQVAPTGGAQLTPIVGASGSDGSSLQYGTAEFIYQIVVDTPANECPVDFNHGYKISETQYSIESMVWRDRNTGPRKLGSKGFISREWYYLVQLKPDQNISISDVKPTKSISDLVKIKQKLMHSCTAGDPIDCPLDQNFTGLQTVSCQYVTTGSPWIYAYPAQAQSMTISLDPIGGVSYTQPTFTHQDMQSWTFTANTDGSLQFANGLVKKALHWEYFRHDLNQAYNTYQQRNISAESYQGFVIATNQTQTFIAELARRMGLNQIETQNLISEFNRPSNTISAPYTRISFVPQNFLETYIPLKVLPKPRSLQRVYLEVKPLYNFEKLVTPQLPIISHQPETVIEVGLIFPVN